MLLNSKDYSLLYYDFIKMSLNAAQLNSLSNIRAIAGTKHGWWNKVESDKWYETTKVEAKAWTRYPAVNCQTMRQKLHLGHRIIRLLGSAGYHMFVEEIVVTADDAFNFRREFPPKAHAEEFQCSMGRRESHVRRPWRKYVIFSLNVSFWILHLSNKTKDPFSRRVDPYV